MFIQIDSRSQKVKLIITFSSCAFSYDSVSTGCKEETSQVSFSVFAIIYKSKASFCFGAKSVFVLFLFANKTCFKAIFSNRLYKSWLNITK